MAAPTEKFLKDPAAFAAAVVLAAALFMIIGALVFEHVLGYQPCELCFLQRKPWYALIPLGFVLVIMAAGDNRGLLKAGLALALVLLLVSAALGVWHAGIEWKWWKGPATCTASGTDFTLALPDLNRRVVLCDEAPLRILGLSLAGWNAVISLAVALVVARGLFASRTTEAN